MNKRNQWERTYRNFRKQGPAFETYVIRPEMMLTALLGNPAPKSRQLMQVVGDFLSRLTNPKEWPCNEPPLCLTCDHSFAPGAALPFAIIVTIPCDVKGGMNVMASGLCPRCSHKTDEEISLVICEKFGATAVEPGHA